MNNLLRGLIAGIGAKKFGGGCLGTIVVFVLIYVALGQCSNTMPQQKNNPPKIKKVSHSPTEAFRLNSKKRIEALSLV